MRHVVIFSSMLGFDGLENLAILDVEVVGVADSVEDAIGLIGTDYEARNADGRLAEELRRGRSCFDPKPWFLRSAGAKGDELHAGIDGADTLLYRAIPTA